MRLSLVLMAVLFAVNVAVDFYIWCRIAICAKRRRWGRVYALMSLFCLLLLVMVICMPRRSGDDATFSIIMWVLYAYSSIYISKMAYCVLSLFDFLPCLWHHPRWKVPGRVGVLAGVAVFAALWWGALINRFSIDVNHVDIESTDLPQQFDGYRVAQISDLHLGTFGSDTLFVASLVDRINLLNVDAVVFTGDIVNRQSVEMEPFVATLSRLTAPDGVYSVLGNHDYGDYFNWPDEDAKQRNIHHLIDLQAQANWQLLNNESRFIRRGTDSIAIVGVENWGDPPFSVYGDLPKAYPTLSDSTFKILLTHNPAHWEKEVANRDSVRVGLTLSGHTHAMQIQIGSWSPAKWRYRTWGGLYSDSLGRHPLYVNVGVGEVAIPMRLGATPEITVLTLKKKQ